MLSYTHRPSPHIHPSRVPWPDSPTYRWRLQHTARTHLESVSCQSRCSQTCHRYLRLVQWSDRCYRRQPVPEYTWKAVWRGNRPNLSSSRNTNTYPARHILLRSVPARHTLQYRPSHRTYI